MRFYLMKHIPSEAHVHIVAKSIKQFTTHLGASEVTDVARVPYP